MERNSGIGIRNRLAFLLAHFGLLRGDNIRRMELCDLQSQILNNEGFSECAAVSIVMGSGKTNRYGRKEIAAFLRNKDVRLCPVGGLAIYMLHR